VLDEEAVAQHVVAGGHHRRRAGVDVAALGLLAREEVFDGAGAEEARIKSGEAV
jgi:hypothetical protein